MLHILCVSRSPRFSPNSVDRDAAILAAVVARLQRKGHEVFPITEDLLETVDLSEFDLVCSMARSTAALQALHRAVSSRHLCVVNAPLALLHGTRQHLAEVFDAAQIPQPSYVPLHVGQPLSSQLPKSWVGPFWLKRADACAQHACDVQFVTDISQVGASLQAMADAGASSVLAVQHVPGDLVKFYGVEGTDFFHCHYPTESAGFSKFGLEQHNGAPHHYSYSQQALKETADLAARQTGFTVYGGDAVILPDGTFRLIDFNDWPSFSACRREAAKAIASRALQLAE
ncbi:MAG: hypothetical protein ACI3YD_01370 [Alloprevotella sp.]